MKTYISIQLKATLLIVIFLLNTVVGFACTLGIDMKFNSKHHHSVSTIHDHHQTKETKNNCCKDEVSKLTKSDKQSEVISSFNFQPVHSAIVPDFFYTQISLSSIFVNTHTNYIARQCRAPVTDIRIAIQSFQI
ncbi:HYC_CC_PP family protein [Pedobacter cryoconitis]|uniref:Uncharacterized protein n=1 Tax=Pedobacter cryoconitis TaxID=188932 RepID=A0A7X0MGG0_9SPHI|nr:hypothetical protein [Pedobacter cryoconitis]MBB6498049.1 hypothetical protein [Pedobacter cryoconitis]